MLSLSKQEAPRWREQLNLSHANPGRYKLEFCTNEHE
jgi:hypothetical protein